MATIHRSIIHPAWTLRCDYPLRETNLRDLYAEDNVLKTSFEADLTNGFLGLCSIDVVTRSPLRATWVAANIRNIFGMTMKKCKKIEFRRFIGSKQIDQEVSNFTFGVIGNTPRVFKISFGVIIQAETLGNFSTVPLFIFCYRFLCLFRINC